MPIYEFKCLKCEAFNEILFMGADDTVELKCSECGGEDLERILSSSSYAMAEGGSGAKPSVGTENRSCSGGNCTTWTLPGHSR